jgi:hypothetical protein
MCMCMCMYHRIFYAYNMLTCSGRRHRRTARGARRGDARHADSLGQELGLQRALPACRRDRRRGTRHLHLPHQGACAGPAARAALTVQRGRPRRVEERRLLGAVPPFGRVGRTALRLGCSTHSGGVPQPLGPAPVAPLVAPPRTVAASVTCGCSLRYIRLQPPLHTASGSPSGSVGGVAVSLHQRRPCCATRHHPISNPSPHPRRYRTLRYARRHLRRRHATGRTGGPAARRAHPADEPRHAAPGRDA